VNARHLFFGGDFKAQVERHAARFFKAHAVGADGQPRERERRRAGQPPETTLRPVRFTMTASAAPRCLAAASSGFSRSH